MVSPSRWVASTISLVLVVIPQLAPAGQPVADRQADRYGDPLPDRAIARLGTVFLRPEGGATSVAFSPDSKIVAVGGKRRVYLWEVASGRQVRLLEGHHDWVSGLAFSPDGETVASCDYSLEPSVRFWDVKTGRLLRAWKTPRHSVYRIAFSPDGTTLAIGHRKGVVQLRNIATGKEVRQWAAHPRSVDSLAFSPDGGLLATGCSRSPPALWDTATGKRVRRFTEAAKETGWVSFSRDGKTLVAGGDTNACDVLEVASGKRKQRISHPPYMVDGVSADHKFAALNRGTSSMMLIDVATGRVLRELIKSPANGNFSSGGNCACFSPDSSLLAFRSSYGAVLIWKTATGELIPSPEPRSWVQSIVASPDGERLAVRYLDDPLTWLWRTTDGELRQTIDADRDVSFSPDGKVLAAARRKEIVLFDAASGKLIRGMRHEGDVSFASVAFAPGGKLLAAGAYDGRVLLFDPMSGHLQRSSQLHPVVLDEDEDGRPVTDTAGPLRFFAGGRALAFGSFSRSSAGLCDPAAGTVFRRFPPTPSGGWLPAVSPDGKTVAVVQRGSWGSKSVEVYEVASGQLRQRIATNSYQFHDVAYSPSGQVLATGGHDAVIRFWDLFTGAQISQLEGHRGPVRAVAFLSQDRFASGSDDSTVLVWQRPFQEPARTDSRKLSQEELESLWKSLASNDAPQAYRAIQRLAAAPRPTLAWMKHRLTPTPAPPSQKVKRWIAELDDDQFAVREKATRNIHRMGDLAAPTLRKALAGPPPPEVKMRVTGLLAKITSRTFSPESLRRLRAIEVLEWIGTIAARRKLAELARGAAGSEITLDAKRALNRFRKSRRAAGTD